MINTLHHFNTFQLLGLSSCYVTYKIKEICSHQHSYCPLYLFLQQFQPQAKLLKKQYYKF